MSRAEIQAILGDEEKLGSVTKAVFDQVDTDGSGFIDRAELRSAIMNIQH